MMKFMGVVCAAVTALVIGFAPIPSATAAPVMTASGGLIRDTAPSATSEVGWHGGRGFRGHRGFRGGVYRPARFYRPHRAYRPFRPVYVGGGYGYGVRCFWRPARQVWTHYGWRFIPARRVCRY